MLFYKNIIKIIFQKYKKLANNQKNHFLHFYKTEKLKRNRRAISGEGEVSGEPFSDLTTASLKPGFQGRVTGR